MKRILVAILLMLLVAARLQAAQSVIVDSDGYACMGEDKSRKQTVQMAFQDSKRKATEQACTYIQSETQVNDAMLEKDLVKAYAHAQVKVVQEILKEWYRDPDLGDCYRVRLKVEVIPEEKTMAALAEKNADKLENDPAAPLQVKIWTDRPAYLEKECMRIYLKGNKPFYGRVVYSQADGSHIQLLPNPYRKKNYFNGGTVYELPGGEDRYHLGTCAPFGAEKITLYAGTAPLGNIDVEAADAVYAITGKRGAVSAGSRGVKVSPGNGKATAAVEFVEAAAEVKTARQSRAPSSRQPSP